MTQMLELFALACLPAFLLLDLVVQHRRFTTTRYWRLKALAVTAVVFALSIAVPLLWGDLLGARSLVDGSRLGILGGGLIGILGYELVAYWYHRAVHRFDVLWRNLHQMHHSAESIDAFGANFLHPLDAFFFTSFSTLVSFPVLGLEPEAGAIVGAFLAFNAMFQHANLRTPRWLGYIIQRPESHCVHHQRGVHAFNYADLPLVDMIFGTFKNPETFDGEAGFYTGGSDRVLEMLTGRDVSRDEPAREAPATGQRTAA
jgi:sterol desaturase/sphingolipid hydroxylase (fatty acid hydroxylase superfamily)